MRFRLCGPVWRFCFVLAASSCVLADEFGLDILDELYPEDFFKAPNIGQMALSPNGERFIYTRAASGLYSFVVADSKTMEKEVFMGKNPQSDFISYVDWKDEDRIIFQTQFGNVYLLDLMSNERSLLYDAKRLLVFWNAVLWENTSVPRVLSLLPNDQSGILVSAYDSVGKRVVHRIDLKSKKSKTMVRSMKGIDAWFADHDGEVRMGVNYRSKRVSFHYRKGKQKNFVSLDRMSGKDSGLVVDIDRQSVSGRKDFFLGFDFDPRYFFYASNREANTTTIFRFDTETQTVVEKVASDDTYDFFDTTAFGAPYFVSLKNRKWVGLYLDKEKPSTLWLDDSFRAIQAKIDKKSPESVNLIYDWDLDEEIFLLRSIRGDRPAVFHLYDSFEDRISKIGSMNDAMLGQDLQEMQPIYYVNRDGMRIHGYYTPAKSSEEVAPMIMLVHGGPWARDSYGYNPEVQWLAYRGYSVLQINYRGSTGYGYEHFNAARNDYGWGIQNDIEDARLWAIEEGFAEEGKIAIMGSSYGGYASMLAVSTKPDAYRCAVAMSGIYDLVEETKRIKEETYGGLPYQSWKQMVGDEIDDKAKLREISPTTYVSRIERPVLLVHGDLDSIASVDHARTLEELLKNAGKDFEYIEVEGEGHGFYHPKNQALVYGSVVEFLDREFSK